MRSLRSILAASIVLGAMASATPLLAKEGHEHAADHDKEKSHFQVAPPPTVKDAWALLTTKIAEAEKHLSESKLGPVHEIGEHLEAAVHTLQEKSDMVAADKKSNLSSALKQLDKAVDALHHAAEEGDAAHTTTELKKVAALMPLIESLYPAGALK